MNCYLDFLSEKAENEYFHFCHMFHAMPRNFFAAILAAVLLVPLIARTEPIAGSDIEPFVEKVIENRCPQLLEKSQLERSRLASEQISKHFYYRVMWLSLRDSKCELVDHLIDGVEEMGKIIQIRQQGAVTDEEYGAKEREISALINEEDVRREQLLKKSPVPSVANIKESSLFKKYLNDLGERLLDEPLPRQAYNCTYFGEQVRCSR